MRRTDKTHLESKHRLYIIGAAISFLIAFAAWLLHVPLKMAYITMPSFMIGGLLGVVLSNKARMIGSGLKGEKYTKNLLSKLPENVYVYNDLKVKADGRESEMDNIIVSPSGVFVLETKNHNGRIVGNAEDKYWTQHKVGRKGTPYSKQMYSPVKQVGTHVYRLSQYLKANGVNVWVNGGVFFSNHEAEVLVKNTSKIPVFSHYESDELLDYVTTVAKKELSEHEIQRIVELLNKVKMAS